MKCYKLVRNRRKKASDFAIKNLNHWALGLMLSQWVIFMNKWFYCQLQCFEMKWTIWTIIPFVKFYELFKELIKVKINESRNTWTKQPNEWMNKRNQKQPSLWAVCSMSTSRINDAIWTVEMLHANGKSAFLFETLAHVFGPVKILKTLAICSLINLHIFSSFLFFINTHFDNDQLSLIWK